MFGTHWSLPRRKEHQCSMLTDFQEKLIMINTCNAAVNMNNTRTKPFLKNTCLIKTFLHQPSICINTYYPPRCSAAEGQLVVRADLLALLLSVINELNYSPILGTFSLTLQWYMVTAIPDTPKTSSINKRILESSDFVFFFFPPFFLFFS